MADRVGQQLGNYRLIRLLGLGGFAEVYLAEHLRLKTYAAIKVLYGQMSTGDIQSFTKEAQTIATLRHPHIISIFDFDVYEGVPFLIMDYAPNGSLAELHPSSKIVPIATVLSYTRQIGDALQFAHDQHFIHRDIKPENILVGRQHELLLSDFGISTIAHNSTSIRTQTIVGTTPYMAPEQILGKPCAASDQYALGIILYGWLCGRPPFLGSAMEIVTQHLSAPPLPLRTYNSTLSPHVEFVVLKALAKQPQQRFATVNDFVMALEQAQQDTIQGKPAPFLESSPLATITSSPSSPPSIEQSSLAKDQLYESFRKQIQNEYRSAQYGRICGVVVVCVQGNEVGKVIHLLEEDHWIKRDIYYEKVAYAKKYTVSSSTILAAVFKELQPQDYIVWDNPQSPISVTVRAGATSLVDLQAGSNIAPGTESSQTQANSQQSLCPSCGSLIGRPGWLYCRNCGQKNPEREHRRTRR